MEFYDVAPWLAPWLVCQIPTVRCGAVRVETFSNATVQWGADVVDFGLSSGAVSVGALHQWLLVGRCGVPSVRLS